MSLMALWLPHPLPEGVGTNLTSPRGPEPPPPPSGLCFTPTPIPLPPPDILLAPGTSRQARRRHLSCPGSSARADTPNPAGRIQRRPNSLRGWVLRGQEGRAQVSSQLESELRAITASLLSRKPPHRLTERPPGSSHPGHWRGTDKPDRQALCPPQSAQSEI